MTDERINELLYTTRTAEHPYDSLKQRTQNMIMAETIGKERGMKHMGIKKTLVFVAVFCLLFSTAVAAFGLKKASVMRNTAGEFTEYADIAKAYNMEAEEVKARILADDINADLKVKKAMELVEKAAKYRKSK